LLALSGHGQVRRTDRIQIIAAFYSPFAACDAASIRGQVIYTVDILPLVTGEIKKGLSVRGTSYPWTDNRCSGWDLNRAPPDLNPTALPLHSISTRSAVTHCRVPLQFHPKHTMFFDNEALSFNSSQSHNIIWTIPPTKIC
jgi:hypothetical protein